MAETDRIDLHWREGKLEFWREMNSDKIILQIALQKSRKSRDEHVVNV